jgi:signal peptidase I
MRPRALIAVLVVATALLVARRLDVAQVRGRSMAPTLLSGDRLLVVRARPRAGDVVLAPDPGYPTRELVKRVTSIDAGGIDLRGDNPLASSGARVAPEAVRWRALLCYWPRSRMGLVSAPFRPRGCTA